MGSQKTRTLDDGITVLDVGYRNSIPVALVVKKYEKYDDEYIIGFNYEIKDNKINWGYGYYYGTNIEKEKNDFQEVLAGKNIADTFNQENVIDNKETLEIRQKIEDILKKDMEYKDYTIDFLLVDENDKENAVAVAINDGELISIIMPSKEINKIDDRYYNYDDYLFSYLEEGKRIEFMTMYVHYCVWKEIRDEEPERIKAKLGLENYFKYCKENKITKEKIDKELNEKDTPNIMQYYKENKIKSRER